MESLIRKGLYAGPLNHCLVAVGGGACGRNPFDWMEYLRRSPQGSVLTWENTMRGTIPMTAMAVMLGIHVRVGIEDNIWRVKGERFTTVKQVEQMVRLAEAFGRKVATADEARQIMKIGTWYNSPEETLFHLGLPPNHKEGEPGFLGWDTTGKRVLAQAASDSHAMAYCLVGPDAVDTARSARIAVHRFCQLGWEAAWRMSHQSRREHERDPFDTAREVSLQVFAVRACASPVEPNGAFLTSTAERCQTCHF